MKRGEGKGKERITRRVFLFELINIMKQNKLSDIYDFFKFFKILIFSPFQIKKSKGFEKR